MRDGQAAINGSLQGTEHLVACGGSGEAGVQVAGESARLAVDALHIELVARHLHLALVHLVQAKLVQELRRQSDIASEGKSRQNCKKHTSSVWTYSAGEQQTSAVGCCVVGQANRDAVLGQLV